MYRRYSSSVARQRRPLTLDVLRWIRHVEHRRVNSALSAVTSCALSSTLNVTRPIGGARVQRTVWSRHQPGDVTPTNSRTDAHALLYSSVNDGWQQLFTIRRWNWDSTFPHLCNNTVHLTVALQLSSSIWYNQVLTTWYSSVLCLSTRNFCHCIYISCFLWRSYFMSSSFSITYLSYLKAV